jgi:hypothetical protein
VSRSTRAGTAAERAVVTYLQANGFPHAERALNLAAALAEARRSRRTPASTATWRCSVAAVGP